MVADDIVGMPEDVASGMFDDCILSFTIVCMDVVVVTFPSDEERKQVLKS